MHCALSSNEPTPPFSCANRLTSRRSIALRRSIHTGLHRPTGAAGGDQPGVRPSNVVRIQRSCWCATIGVRQRGRGRLLARKGSRGANRINSSFEAPTSGERSTSCRSNMFVDSRRGEPFSRTSAKVASPSNPSTRRSPSARTGASNRCRNHHCSLSKARGAQSRLHWPRFWSADATVPGTVAASHWLESDGSLGECVISHPVVSRSRR